MRKYALIRAKKFFYFDLFSETDDKQTKDLVIKYTMTSTQ